MELDIHTCTHVGLLPEKRMSVLTSSLMAKKEKCGSVVSPQFNSPFWQHQVLYFNTFSWGRNSLFVL